MGVRMHRPSLRRASGAAMVACVLAMVVQPASGATPERPELRATTVVVGDETSSVQVHLPRPARIDAHDPMTREDGPNPDIRIEGAGRYAGVVLVRDDWAGGVHTSDFLLAGRWGLCDAPGCAPESVVNDVRGLARDAHNNAIVPAGDYTLHLVADSARVKVTLRLAGAPPGTATFHPDGEAMVDFDAPAVEATDVNAASNLRSAGGRFDSGRIGFSASLLYVRAGQDLDPFNGGVCQINSPAAPPDVSGYGPHCFALTRAGLGNGFYLLNRSIDRRTLAMLPLFTYHDQYVQPPNLDGSRGLGAWAATPYDITEFRFMGLFVRVA